MCDEIISVWQKRRDEATVLLNSKIGLMLDIRVDDGSPLPVQRCNMCGCLAFLCGCRAVTCNRCFVNERMWDDFSPLDTYARATTVMYRYFMRAALEWVGHDDVWQDGDTAIGIGYYIMALYADWTLGTGRQFYRMVVIDEVCSPCLYLLYG